MTTKLNTSDTKRRNSLQAMAPFVGHNIPFVWYIRPLILPFVCNKLPFVPNKRFESGFTLIELIIAALIVGILAAIAAPSVSSFIQNNRITSQSNDFLTDLMLARVEAIKRSSNVVVCKSADSTLSAAVVSCDLVAANPWSTGRIIFMDTSPYNDRYMAGEGDLLLYRSDALSGGNSLTTTDVNFQNAVAYTPLGVLRVATAGSFHLCDNRGNTFGRRISLVAGGRAAISGRGNAAQNPVCP